MNMTLPSDLSGVIITGASSEIGQEVASRLVQNDSFKVLVTANRSKIPDRISRMANVSSLQGLDLTNVSDLEVLKNAAFNLFDGPFGFIHSVGAFWNHKSIVQCEVGEALNMITSHYLTLYGVLHNILPTMVAKGGGRILAFSCTSVGFHYPDMAPFTSAKAAVESLIKCTANEWSEHGISANAIALSTVATPKVMESKPLAEDENYISQDEVCDLVSDVLFSASNYLSGNVIRPLKYSNTYYNTSYFERNPRMKGE